MQASTSDTIQYTDTHTIYRSNSGSRCQEDFTFCYNISCFMSSNSNPTKSYVQKELQSVTSPSLPLATISIRFQSTRLFFGNRVIS